MKDFFRNLFDDGNNINEKSVLGFLSFAIIIIFAFVYMISDLLGNPLKIEETLFNAFLYITIGSLGIGSFDKFINKNGPK